MAEAAHLEAALRRTLRVDAGRMASLAALRDLGLPDAWIGAGFVREAAWDALHGWPPSPPRGDVDVAWFDPARATAGVDHALEAELRRRRPNASWSVKNQARMHARNGDAPYRDTADAVRHWPETATAVAVRLGPGGDLEILAPHGLGDLAALLLRPTPAFAGERRAVVEARIDGKGWLRRWPGLQLAAPSRHPSCTSVPGGCTGP